MTHQPDYTQPTPPPSSLQVECLLAEAKMAVLQDHVQRSQTLKQEGRWLEALDQQCKTLLIALDLLKDSVAILECIIDNQKTHTTENRIT